jgi:hypothetical protein
MDWMVSLAKSVPISFQCPNQTNQMELLSVGHVVDRTNKGFKMNIEELEEALDELFPAGFSIETDNHGQIVVYTGLKHSDSEEGDLVPFDAEEDEDYDPDTESLEDEDLDDEE